MTHHAAGRADRRALRVIKCLRLLEGACYSPQDLARRFGVSKRTVYRDLRLLARAGVPIVRRAGERGCHVTVYQPGPADRRPKLEQAGRTRD